MSERKSNASGGGIGFCGLLTILFIGLKLGGVIGWSWWAVLAPLWVPAVIVVGVLAVIFAVVCWGSSMPKRRRA